VDFGPVEKMMQAGDWASTAALLSDAARRIEKAGADFLVICTNTMHIVAPQIESAIQIPLLHIADATAEVLVKDNIKTVGLLGTSFTMEQPFYRQRLMDGYGLEVLVPDAEDRQTVHQIIFQELCLGTIVPDSRAAYLRIIHDLAARGAQAVILGCTEIGMLVRQTDTRVLLLDTTAIHAQKAVSKALEQDSYDI
jgi:aspartate racemase